MANIQPQSEVRLFKNVRLDKGYKHGVYIGNTAGCTQTYLDTQLMTDYHHLYTLTEYTYIREDSNIIRVKMKADDLWNVNYLCYKNPIMGAVKPNKWFFGFVDKTVYVNNEVTDIYFTPDILTTWWEEAELAPCFVERMHEPNEDFGSNIINENISVGEYKYAIQPAGTPDNLSNTDKVVKQSLFSLRPTWTVFAVCDSTFDGGASAVYDNAIPRTYDGVVSGYRLFAWKTNELTDPDSTWTANLKEFLKDYFNLYRTMDKTLLGVFTLPRELLDDTEVEFTWTVGSSQTAFPQITGHDDHTTVRDFDGYPINGNTTLDGYLPVNLKMYTAPYCVCQFVQPDGQEMIMNHEYMMNRVTGSGYSFRIQTGMCCLYGIMPPYILVFRPYEGYGCDGSVPNLSTELYGSDASKQIVFKNLPQGTWKNGISTDIVRDIIAPMIVDLPFLVAGMQGMMNPISTISPMTKRKNGQRVVKEGRKNKFKTTWSEEQVTEYGLRESNTGELQSIRGVQEFLGNATRMNIQQPISGGHTEVGYSPYAARVGDFQTYCKCINHQDAERIDNFFSVYGYAQCKVMQPYRMTRQKWTYLKTADCLVHGDLPSELCYELSEIYNQGITFWRSLDEINDYAFQRGINMSLVTPLE